MVLTCGETSSNLVRWRRRVRRRDFPLRTSCPAPPLRPLRTLLTAVVALASAGAAQAQYLDSPFKYNYLELNFAMTELDDVPPRQEGFGGRLSIAAEEGVRLLVVYDEMEAKQDGVQFRRQELQAGVGFMTSPANSVDMILDIKYLRGESKYYGKNRTEHGYGIEFGTRSLLHQLVELDISGEYREWFKSELGARVGLRFLVTENFAIGARATWFETQEMLTAGLRFSL